jgi:hypothetical protein
MTVAMFAPTLLISAAWYLSISICAYKLARMAGYERPVRAFLPVENIGMLYEIAGKRRSQSRWALFLLLGLPIIGAVMFATLGGALMEQTGRSRLPGYVLAIPPVALLGLPLIAYSARMIRVPSARTCGLPAG